jgi:hypothetical protein
MEEVSSYNSDSVHKRGPVQDASDSSDFFSARGKHKSRSPDFDWKHEALMYRALALGLIKVFRKEGQMIVLPIEEHKQLVQLNVPDCKEVNLVPQVDEGIEVREAVCCCCPCWFSRKRMPRNPNLMHVSYMRCKNSKGEWGLADSLNPGVRDWFFQHGISPDIVRIQVKGRKPSMGKRRRKEA